jgi:hypothetical protein
MGVRGSVSSNSHRPVALSPFFRDEKDGAVESDEHAFHHPRAKMRCALLCSACAGVLRGAATSTTIGAVDVVAVSAVTPRDARHIGNQDAINDRYSTSACRPTGASH